MEPPRPAPAWAITVRLRSSGLDLRMAAANVLPGWGRGSERLSLLLRIRRRLRLAVTSECRPCSPPHTPATTRNRSKLFLRFLGKPLGFKWLCFIKRRKKKRDASSSSWQITKGQHSLHTQCTQRLEMWRQYWWLCHDRRWMVWLIVVLASVPIFQIMVHSIFRRSCRSAMLCHIIISFSYIFSTLFLLTELNRKRGADCISFCSSHIQELPAHHGHTC